MRALRVASGLFVCVSSILVTAPGCAPRRRAVAARFAFDPLLELLTADELEAVRLELYDYTGPERKTTIITSRDPRVLSEVYMGVRVSVRKVFPSDGGIGVMTEGKLFLAGRSRTVPIMLTMAGFAVGDWGAYDPHLFYSPRLALAVDDMLCGKKQEHLNRHLIAGLSYPDWVTAMFNREPSTLEELMFPLGRQKE